MRWDGTLATRRAFDDTTAVSSPSGAQQKGLKKEGNERKADDQGSERGPGA